MMTPADKQALEQRARDFGITPSDFVRRASENYDPRVDEAMFKAFLTEFEETDRAMCAALKATNDSIDATRAEMLALRAAHQVR